MLDALTQSRLSRSELRNHPPRDTYPNWKVLQAMTLTLYLHPLASFCHKVLLALYETDTPFEPRLVDLADPDSSADLLAHWPVGKIPVLHDAARQRAIPETSIIVEYLVQHYPSARALIPADPDQALQARLWDRFCDNYVQVPMQKYVGDRLRPESARDPYGVAEAERALHAAFDMLERQLTDRTWLIGDRFSFADCAAAPALFYAHTIVPFGAQRPQLAAYFERWLERPSFQRVLREARPYFPNYPLHDALPARFWNL
jgi:glutathione S-transferase